MNSKKKKKKKTTKKNAGGKCIYNFFCGLRLVVNIYLSLKGVVYALSPDVPQAEITT